MFQTSTVHVKICYNFKIHYDPTKRIISFLPYTWIILGHKQHQHKLHKSHRPYNIDDTGRRLQSRKISFSHEHITHAINRLLTKFTKKKK